MVPLPEHLLPVPVGREPLSRKVIAEHQRDRVLDAAIGVFAKRGYQGTTVDNIVAAGRIGVGSFYELFDGKEDCFLQAYDRIVGDAREKIAANVQLDAPWSTQVVAFLRTSLALIAAHPLAARIALVEIQTAGPVALNRHADTLQSLFTLLSRGRHSSPFAAVLPRTLEEATVGGVAWLLHQRIVIGDTSGIGNLLPDLLTIVIGPYLGEEEARRLAAAQVPSI